MLVDNNTLLSKIPNSLPPDTPVIMLNLLQWNEKATYTQDYALPPCSGREAYMHRYIPAFSAIASKVGGFTVLYMGVPVSMLVGPEEDNNKWDIAALVKYPNIETFRRIVGSEEYATAALQHRDAALKDWRLFVTTESEP
ncbi:uncharacterized protein Z518_08451 [Rhinocladiella mackenziei CBS 650.93]|uniref:DUF1330 domain-containing protein n=1 Tax=Rhinocladiella mackenziei CBS 650.93 TaxID=1442369 RepID=A0A0D2J0Y5_9EURO|nr:uncharacterized protein Z518_08451 [Rhinocladiella mackenziei CBS 650.93]KIX02510.1 hypothetical protein Z518_08451 [Rhinocladiella mackenziei CBS 650.93]